MGKFDLTLRQLRLLKNEARGLNVRTRLDDGIIIEGEWISLSGFNTMVRVTRRRLGEEQFNLLMEFLRAL
jgi:hypothetical protein